MNWAIVYNIRDDILCKSLIQQRWFTHINIFGRWIKKHEKLTLLTTKSFSSKWRPNILGASPGIGSIFTHTSWPFRADSTGLWLYSMLVTTPKSTNCKIKPIQRFRIRYNIYNHSIIGEFKSQSYNSTSHILWK